MNVQAKNEERPSNSLQLLDQQLVSFIVKDLLVLPARKRMRRGGDNHQISFCRQARDDAAQAGNIRARFLNVLADAGADLNHRLDHLRLDLLAEDHLAFFQEFRDVRTQLARFRINNLEFFFDSQRELVKHMNASKMRTTGLPEDDWSAYPSLRPGTPYHAPVRQFPAPRFVIDMAPQVQRRG